MIVYRSQDGTLIINANIQKIEFNTSTNKYDFLASIHGDIFHKIGEFNSIETIHEIISYGSGWRPDAVHMFDLCKSSKFEHAGGIYRWYGDRD